MTQYIDKSALVAEIERRRKQYANERNTITKNNENYHVLGRIKMCDDILSFIDSLEVKEVDLEDVKKEELAQKYIDYIFKRNNIDPASKEGLLIYYAYMHGMNQCLTQLKAQKGEEV